MNHRECPTNGSSGIGPGGYLCLFHPGQLYRSTKEAPVVASPATNNLSFLIHSNSVDQIIDGRSKISEVE